MRKNEIQPHEAVNHTTEFPSGQRGWTQDPLLRLRRFESCLRHHSFHTKHASVQPYSGIRQDPANDVSKCGEQDSNLRTVEDCDLNAAPLTKLGDPRVT